MKNYHLSTLSIFLSILLFSLAACSTEIQREGQKILLLADQNEQTQQLLEEVKASVNALPITHLSKWDKLKEKELLTYSSLLIFQQDLKQLSPRMHSLIERYVQSSGGLILIDSYLDQKLSWPWFEKFNSIQIEKATAVKVSDIEKTTAPNRNQHYDGGRIVSLSQKELGALKEALSFTIGRNLYDPSKMKSPLAPQDNRFTRKLLDDQLIEPMELAVLPGNKVLFIERRGKMKLYEPESNRTRLIHNFEVCTSGNYEDGLLGLAADPNFEQNHYIYLYYSPDKNCGRAQALSRFTFPNADTLNLASEKVILEVPVQRKTCCHSGGSITFGPQGNLWLSTGDNTSSKESNGYSPLDERPGRGPYDAQKSSANTHDLRGKVLRIKPNKYGTYDIPDGNLFPKDGSKGRPEIYAMGARNPFRIAVDHKTGYVYWGDVGPDAGLDGKFGPQSYDEFNQAREPGYFGWPYFMGDNKAFPDRDFETDEIGELFDPAKPINNSPHNTGQEVLPPAQAALIWYPKQASPDFPMLGQGSNSAMAGPIYYRDMYQEPSQHAFPAYYEGKWFIYEWARSWIKLITFDEEGELSRIEPFLTDLPLSKPIEMEFGPDGAMYILEYGQNYFADNPDARLIKLEYAASNRAPIAEVKADTYAGAAPLAVHFDASQSYDHDEDDSIEVEWFFTDVEKPQARGEKASFTFEKEGIYEVRAKLTDSLGAMTWFPLSIQVGNTVPKLEIALDGNKSFYKHDAKLNYNIEVDDPEDAASGTQRAADFRFLFVENQDILDRMSLEEVLDRGSMSHLEGQKLIADSDCATCHALNIKSVGPSYFDIADRYRGQYDMVGYLAGKIISGGNGNWGEKIMAGHPQHTLEECSEMVRYILSLDESSRKPLASSGNLAFNKHDPAKKSGIYILSAFYTDEGKAELAPLSNRKTFMLRNPRLAAKDFDEGNQVSILVSGENRDIERVKQIRHGSWIAFKEIDLTNIKKIAVNALPLEGGKISVRLASPEGEEITSVQLSGKDWVEISGILQEKRGFEDLYFVFLNEQADQKQLMELDAVEFIF